VNQILRILLVLIALIESFWSQSLALGQENTLSSQKARSKEGLLALYNFCETGGPVVRDQSGGEKPIHLRIQSMRGVRRLGNSIKLTGVTRLLSEQAPTSLIQTIQNSGSFTIEAWITPASTLLKGPARIVTLSRNGSERNFTLGQDGDKYDVRCRSSQTDKNGLPSIASESASLSTGLTHVVFTLGNDHVSRIYINGDLNSEGQVPGTLSVWKNNVQLSLGNEVKGNRQWKGTFHMVALYGRSLSGLEVTRHFQAGAYAEDTKNIKIAVQGKSPEAAFFEHHIAPVISEHCLECHDTHNQKGELDLSWKESAFKGGKHGMVIVPGKPEESELWLSVHHDEMPDNRTMLSSEQKALIKQWIQDGATWSLEHIDPVLYSHQSDVASNWVRRLTVSEYIRTVKNTVGIDIAEDAHDLLPIELRADGFSNTAYNLNVDLKHVNAYAQLAEKIVQRMDVESFTGRFVKNLKFTDNEMGALIDSMGKWVLRGPVNEHELFAYRGITTSVAAAGGSYEEAVGLVIEAMLQSPRFIYRVENHVGDGTVWPLGDHELANRISFILWGSGPDELLIQAADKGLLYSDELLTEQIERMLADDRALQRSLEFAGEWLNLSRLANMQPNTDRFPEWDPILAEDMLNESLAFFRELIWEQKRPLKDLFNARFTYVTPRLAAHYGLPAEIVDSSDSTIQKIKLTPETRRGGILTQGSVLTVGGDDASMVARGLFMLHEVLRGVVKDPPPCVDVVPIPTEVGLTQRGIANERINNALCGGCHKKFEPLAFGLEKFDGLGSFESADEHGNVLREDGRIRIPGQPEVTEYNTSLQLVDFLANNERVQETMTWKVVQFALGRPLTAFDANDVQRIHAQMRDNGGTWDALIKAVVLSDLVRNIKTEIINE
tara:strand:+ start:1227 stop:3899 length:2673 start_codon:yes stop_codon:yes gene_type:complete